MDHENKHLPILDVTDTTITLNEFRVKQSAIVDDLVKLGFEYMDKISGKFIAPQNDNYFRLRDSISFRLTAMLFHLSLLLSVQDNHKQFLSKNRMDGMARTFLLDAGPQQQVFLFDSIIFHAISMFDYFGNLIEYICGGKGRMGLQWNGALKSARDPNNLIHSSPVGAVIIDLDNTFVDKLYKHRSELIHFKTDEAGGQAKFHPMTAETNFTVFAPKKLTRLFSDLRDKSALSNLTISYVAFWICENSLSAAHEIIEPLFKHISLNQKSSTGTGIVFHSVRDFGKEK